MCGSNFYKSDISYITFDNLKNDPTPGPWLMHFLGLAKIHKSQMVIAIDEASIPTVASDSLNHNDDYIL